jgi:hypothetical protein
MCVLSSLVYIAYVVIEGNSRADCSTRIAISPRLAISNRDIGRGGGAMLAGQMDSVVEEVRGYSIVEIL